jgi:hypothetical protein
MTTKLKFTTSLLGVLLLGSGYAAAEESLGGWMLDFNRAKEVRPVTNKAYQTECGECHIAYQAGWLPAKSWEKLLTPDALRKHFGVNAEIEADTLKEISDYAIENAADKSYYKRARKVANSTKSGNIPMSITELRYIERKHKPIPVKMVKGNAGVKSLSLCDKCHTQAAKGVFDNDTVSIPNYPNWDD